MLEENASAKKTHGDRVIADALCLKGMDECGIRTSKTLEAPRNSFGGRLRQWEKRQEAIKEKKTWDFRGVI